MPKLKDFLLDINNTLQNNEIEALAGASALAEIEVTDDLLTDAKTKLSSLLTVDAAKNNPDLETHFKKKNYGTIKGELLGNIDSDLLSSAKTLFGEDSADQFKDIEFTGDKIKKFAELTKTVIEKNGGGSDELKKLNQSLNEQVNALNNEILKREKDAEKQLKKEGEKYTNLIIDKEFDANFNAYPLGDKYKEPLFRNALRNDIKQKVTGIAKLTLSEDGKVIPRNPENAGLELFQGNKKIESLKDLLDPFMKDHLKVTQGPGEKSTYVPAKEATKVSALAADLMSRKKQIEEI